MALKVNSKAPDFELMSTSGKRIKLSENLPCIIYFYPKDFTPGCTEEACSFRDQHSFFKGLKINVFGISKDSIDSHLRFKEKHQLPFNLLSDLKGTVCKAYQALIPIVNMPKRVTYLIDENQKILATYSDLLGASKHIEKMINELKSN